jgi:hypothetical protein
MKYTPVFVPLFLVLALIAVRIYRPPLSEIKAAAPGAAIACDGSACR